MFRGQTNAGQPWGRRLAQNKNSIYGKFAGPCGTVGK